MSVLHQLTVRVRGAGRYRLLFLGLILFLGAGMALSYHRGVTSADDSGPISGAADPSDVAATGHTYYVSTRATTGLNNGTSWPNAWKELDQINWSIVQPGDTVILDGGATACPSPYDFTTTRPGVNCGLEYDTTMTLGASGTATSAINIRLATGTGRNGTAVLFGGRATPLPYCHQTNYTATAVRQYGILVNSAIHNVIISGEHRSGIMIYGAVHGVRIVGGSGASNLTFKKMEVFDNGSIGTSSGGGANSSDEGFSIGAGPTLLFRGDIIHDNGQDEIADEPRTGGTLKALKLDTDWLYNRRENPAFPGEPFNDLQRTGDDTCTHSDGVQLSYGDPGKTESNLTVTHSILGPLVNQGVYPGDGGASLNTVWATVYINNSLFLAVSHSIQSDKDVHGWTVSQNTMFAPQGGFQLNSVLNNTNNVFTNNIKYGGYATMDRWGGTASGNVWWLGDPIPGAQNVNPNFVSAPAGTFPTYAAYAAADFTPTSCAACGGSPLHKLSDILTAIDALP